MSFTFPESCGLTRTPTPIEKLERLSRLLEGPTIYVKRDDLTGMALSGNKIRKLDFLLAEAKNKNCDIVITCGGTQSNHARATAIAAAKMGMKCHLVLRDATGGDLDGNLFLDRLVDAEVQFITPEQYDHVDSIMAEEADAMKSKGLHPYVIPEGGSNAMGIIGYLKAAEETVKQLKTMKIRVDKLVFALGSGGTQAGLLLGKFVYDLPMQIIGMTICDDEAFCKNRILKMMEEANKKYGLGVKLNRNDVNVMNYIGKGYGLSSQEELNVIKSVAKTEGIILDPVYTGKAMYGLIDQIHKRNFRPDENILFLHTGGIFGLFPKRGLFF